MGATRLIVHLSNSSACSCEIVASAEPVGSANSRCPAADSNFHVSGFAAHRRSVAAAAALRIFTVVAKFMAVATVIVSIVA